MRRTDLREIQALEEELGSPLLAFSGVAVDGARMGKEKLRKLQALEKKLGVVLVAVKPS